MNYHGEVVRSGMQSVVQMQKEYIHLDWPNYQFSANHSNIKSDL